jgi:hypothetical protein
MARIPAPAQGIEQAFATKCWFFGASIVDSLSQSLASTSLRLIRAIPSFALIGDRGQDFFAKAARQAPYSQRIDGTLI